MLRQFSVLTKKWLSILLSLCWGHRVCNDPSDYRMPTPGLFFHIHIGLSECYHTFFVPSIGNVNWISIVHFVELTLPLNPLTIITYENDCRNVFIYFLVYKLPTITASEYLPVCATWASFVVLHVCPGKSINRVSLCQLRLLLLII